MLSYLYQKNLCRILKFFNLKGNAPRQIKTEMDTAYGNPAPPFATKILAS